MATCCRGSTDRYFLRSHRDGFLKGRRVRTCFRGVKSTPASRKAPNCCICCSASTLLTYRDQQNQSSESAMLATGVKIPDLEDSLNSYLEDITAYLKDNSLLISDPKSLVTLLTPDNTKPISIREHPTITGPMSKDIRSLSRHLSIIQHA